MAQVAQLIVKLIADAQKFTSGLDGATAKLKSFGSSATSMGKTLSATVTAPIAALGAASFKMAADAEESASKFQTVWGDAAGEMSGWLERLQETMPSTTKELQDMSANMLDLLEPLGVAPQRAQEMTREIVQLTGDLASFNNMDPGEVIQRLTAGLLGSFEPLQKFAVALSANQVKAEAYKRGIIGVGQELDAASRAETVWQLILERTTKAQGDAARTVDSAANSLRFMARDSKELTTLIGQELIPTLKPLVDNLRSVTEWISGLDAGTKRWIIGLAGLAAVLGPVLIVVGSLASGIGGLVTLFTTVSAGAIALGAAAGAAFLGIGLAVAMVVAHWDEMGIVIRQAALIAVNALTFLWDSTRLALAGIVGTIVKAMAHINESLVSGLADTVRDMLLSFGAAIPGVSEVLEAIDDKLQQAVKSARKWKDETKNIVIDMGDESKSVISQKLKEWKVVLDEGMTEIELRNRESGETVKQDTKTAYTGATTEVKKAMAEMSAAVSTGAAEVEWGTAEVTGASEEMAAGVSTAFDGVEASVADSTENMTVHWLDAWDSWNGVKAGIEGGMVGLSTTVSTKTEEISESFEGMSDRVNKAVESIKFSGFATNGIAESNYDEVFGGRTFSSFQDFLSSLGVGAFASGGIVTRPTLALVGEAGPEAIVPLGRSGGGLGVGSGGGVVVNVYPQGHVLSDRDLAELIRTEFMRIRSANGSLGI